MNKFFKFFYSFILLSIVPLFLFSIFQITSINSEKNLIQEYQKEIDSVLSENNFEVLGSNISLSDAEELAKKRDFVENSEVTYIEISNTEVVVK